MGKEHENTHIYIRTVNQYFNQLFHLVPKEHVKKLIKYEKKLTAYFQFEAFHR